MVGCSHQDGVLEWFHFACVGLTPENRPSDDWLCPRCTSLVTKGNAAASSGQGALPKGEQMTSRVAGGGAAAVAARKSSRYKGVAPSGSHLEGALDELLSSHRGEIEKLKEQT